MPRAAQCGVGHKFGPIKCNLPSTLGSLPLSFLLSASGSMSRKCFVLHHCRARDARFFVGGSWCSAHESICICALPEVRFTGVGKALLRAMESQAVNAGLTEIHLSSTATAKAFYLRNGFMQSRLPEVEFGIQVFPLTKRLGPSPPRPGVCVSRSRE